MGFSHSPCLGDFCWTHANHKLFSPSSAHTAALMGRTPWLSLTWLTQPDPVVLAEIFLAQVLLRSMLAPYRQAVWG